MKPIRTFRFAMAAALLAGLTGLTGFATSASAAPAARRAAASQPPAAAALAGATALTLSNGTRVAVDAPWAATGHTAMTRSFAAAKPDHFCIYGAAQTQRPKAPPAQPKAPKFTLAIKGFNLAGAPAGLGSNVQVFSATSMRWNEQTIGPDPGFLHGLVTMHVPAGKYWLIGQFSTGNSYRLDIPAQLTVTGNTTATVSARAASSEVTTATPRPAVRADAVFVSSYTLRGGQTFWDCGTAGGTSLWVSPLARAHTTGTLFSATSAQLNSPPAQAVPYTYELDSAAPAGTIASQHLAVTAADLATVHEHFYSDTATTAPWFAFGGPARQFGETGFFAVSTALPMPGDRTVYFEAQPTAVWRPEIASGPLTETPAPQLLHTGQELNTNWNAYPLHPAPNLPPAGVNDLTLLSASRAGNMLILDITPFSDNTPGHTGSGVSRFNGITGSGSYAISANGVKIASGKVNPAAPFGDVFASATVSPKPSQIKFTLTTSRKASGSDLSGTSEDTWTWPSQAEPHAIVPAPWYCRDTFAHGVDRHCAVQDMMTLDYQLAGESLDGTTQAGPQSLGIAISHLPLSTSYRVTHAQLQVSFNNGTSWQPAALTRICHGQVCTNAYRATYHAPAGAKVSLRFTARDSHGATVTETILRAYQTA
ncbi:MAG TPA: hypothetical protein VGI74_25485 [Streptosporangiaceae bacterium]